MNMFGEWLLCKPCDERSLMVLASSRMQMNLSIKLSDWECHTLQPFFDGHFVISVHDRRDSQMCYFSSARANSEHTASFHYNTSNAYMVHYTYHRFSKCLHGQKYIIMKSLNGRRGAIREYVFRPFCFIHCSAMLCIMFCEFICVKYDIRFKFILCRDPSRRRDIPSSADSIVDFRLRFAR